jgi:hypothetical protein
MGTIAYPAHYLITDRRLCIWIAIPKSKIEVQKLDNIMLIPNDAIFNSYLLESG